MTHSICINGERHQIALSHSMILSDMLLQHAAYITSIPSICDNNFLWLLLNENKTVNAFTSTIEHDLPQSIVSIEYAMTYPYFQICEKIMQKNGIYISTVNIGLLIFTLFSWIKKDSTSDFHHTIHTIYNKALTLMQYYSDHFSQPEAFTHTYYEIIERSKKEKTLNIHNALK